MTPPIRIEFKSDGNVLELMTEAQEQEAAIFVRPSMKNRGKPVVAPKVPKSDKFMYRYVVSSTKMGVTLSVSKDDLSDWTRKQQITTTY
jgi:hypothetical protein